MIHIMSLFLRSSHVGNFASFREVLWKRLNTETPQHENGPKKRKPLKAKIFGSVFCFLKIPQIYFLDEFPTFFDPFFFDPFPRFLGRIPVYAGFIFLRDFPIVLIRFLIFWVRFRFSEKVLNSQFEIGFLFFSIRFLIFWVCFRF